MSSLRNAVKRITHKERPQPVGHKGFLERHDDYKYRAVGYHRKEDRLQAMRQKAALRNPDEFYFGMKHAVVADGKHRKTVEAEQQQFEHEVGVDTVRIMKDQDLRYVRMQKQKDAKKVEKLRSSLHLIDAAAATASSTNNNINNKKRKHTVFVSNEQQARDFTVAEHFETWPELAGRAYNRPRKQALQQMILASTGAGQEDGTSDGDDDDDDKGAAVGSSRRHAPTKEEMRLQVKEARKRAKKLARAKEAAYGELRAREKRMNSMKRAEAHLVTEKLVAAKGRKRKIKPAQNGQPAQYLWRRKRLG